MANGKLSGKQLQDCSGKRKTPLQLQSLESLYSREMYPSPKDMQGVAASIGLTYSQVRLWFKDRRRRKDRGKKQSSLLVSKGASSDRACKRASTEGRRQRFQAQESLTSSVGLGKLLLEKSLDKIQVLFSKEYILKCVFRKDGPPLGTEFDPVPAKKFDHHAGYSRYPLLEQGNKKVSRRKRKIQESYSVPAGYGMGKGLMKIWHATNPGSGRFPGITNSVEKSAITLTHNGNKLSSKNLTKLSHRKQKKNASSTKIQEKKRHPTKKREVLFANNPNQEDSYSTECKLALNVLSFQEIDLPLELIDDEELELSDLQSGQNLHRCLTHLTSIRRNGCPLCKDLLNRFPPKCVKLKRPFSTRFLTSSSDFVKKLFKVFRFIYSHAVIIEICPFTLEDLAQAFHEKDSSLLGKIHVALLRLLLSNVEREIAGVLHAPKDYRYLQFLRSVNQHNFNVVFWTQSLNSMTWVEILRQVLIAAGFGPKCLPYRRGIINKASTHMIKYGLRPHTLKGELFSILSEQGNSGLKVSELSRASQIISLSLSNTVDELEDLIHSTLSSDITLFEKIGPSAFRLRSNTAIKSLSRSSDSESDYSGIVDDEYRSSSLSSSADENESSEALSSALCVQNFVQQKSYCRKKRRCLTKHTEIDESFSGEAWVLGLMEGEYSDLSTEEKLDALVSLVDIIGPGISLRVEEPVKTVTAHPHVRHHSSGGKIKRSIVNKDTLPVSSYRVTGVEETLGKPRVKSHDASWPYAHPLQSIHLGYDRRYNSYWLFLGPCDDKDPGHRRIYFESSDDGHWEMIDTKQDLSSLVSVLDRRGKREAHLLASLEKLEKYLFQAMVEPADADPTFGFSKAPVSSDVEVISGDGSSPISDVDNNLLFEDHVDSCTHSTSTTVELSKFQAKPRKLDELQAFDRWIWDSFYCSLNAVNHCKRSYHESLNRCESCHDLFWREEKHCKKCHTTFELDFDLEERYAIHVATCHDKDGSIISPNYKVLPSQLQALKAAIYAIEVATPKEALADSWTKSSHKLWGKRLRRTSSLPEFLQVIADFVGAIKEEWLYKCASSLGFRAVSDDIIVLFQSIPQTMSAVALWMVMLDSHIAFHLERSNSNQVHGRLKGLFVGDVWRSTTKIASHVDHGDHYVCHSYVTGDRCLVLLSSWVVEDPRRILLPILPCIEVPILTLCIRQSSRLTHCRKDVKFGLL